MRTTRLSAIAGALLLAAMAGAQEAPKPTATPGGMKKAEEAAVDGAKDAGKTVGQEGKKVGEATADGAKKAADATATGAKDAGKAVSTDAKKAADATATGAKDAGKAVGQEGKKAADATATGAKAADKAVVKEADKVGADAKNKVILGEYTLIARNPNASAKVVDFKES
jgi:hypothetical protein